MNVNLNHNLEDRLVRRAAVSGKDIATVVNELVADGLEGDELPRPQRVSAEEFARRTTAWIKLHPVLDHAIIDSRESFYEGRE